VGDKRASRIAELLDTNYSGSQQSGAEQVRLEQEEDDVDE